MTKRLTAREWIERRKERETKRCITKGCDNPGTRLGMCRQCYRWYPYDCYIAGAEPTQRKLRSDGYIDIMVEGLWCMEHRAIIMREEGRRLSHAEIVRHYDEDRSNNNRDNLYVTTRAEKSRRQRDQDRPAPTTASHGG